MLTMKCRNKLCNLLANLKIELSGYVMIYDAYLFISVTLFVATGFIFGHRIPQISKYVLRCTYKYNLHVFEHV